MRFYRIEPVRQGSKTLLAALAVPLLALGLVACGGGDGSSSTSAATGEQSGGSSESSSEGAAGFNPKPHNDSGGGSAQYKVKGGDNSIQEFGEEGTASEFEAAAAALHNFLDARAAGDWVAVCGYTSKSVVESLQKLAARAKQIEDKSCGGILEKLVNPTAKQALTEEAEKADVGSLRTDGNRSFVIYTGAEGAALAMPMTNEGGEWKVATLAGTPLG